MKKLMTMTMVLLLSTFLGSTVLAAKPEEKAAPQKPDQAEAKNAVKDPHQSDAFKRQQANVKQREDMKARRDAGLKVRERNVKSNSPGKTGL